MIVMPARCCALITSPTGATITLTSMSWATSACAGPRCSACARRSRRVGERAPKRWPTPASLVLLPQILQHRLRSINAAFKRARESFGYEGGYFLVYPIKVNQHRRVIESLVNSGEPLGLEAGSKAELMAVLAHAGMTRSVIVCNGYKDREYVRLALIGEKLGHESVPGDGEDVGNPDGAGRG